MSLAVGGGQVGGGRTCGTRQGCAGGIWGWVSRGCWALGILGCGKEVTALPVPQHGFGAGGNFQLLPTSIIPCSGPGRWAETRDGKPGKHRNAGAEAMVGFGFGWICRCPLGSSKKGENRSEPSPGTHIQPEPVPGMALSCRSNTSGTAEPGLASPNHLFFLFEEGEYLVIPMP